VTLSARLRSILGLLLAVVLTGVLAAPASATTWKLQASGGGTITTAQTKTLAVTYLRDGRVVAGASVVLQRKSGTSWVNVKTVKTGSKGRATAKVEPNTTTVYRFRTTRTTSGSVTVTVVPATFAIKGSGSGHGVGMPQWGAYQMARDGKTTAQILSYYYRGTSLGTATRADTSLANDAVATIKVQVLGPPADTRTTTTLSLGSGSWRIVDAAGTQVATGTASQPVTVGVTSTGVKASFVQGSATVTKTGSRLFFEWTGTRYYQPSGAQAVVSVAGAQGTYRHGRLELTNRSSRPNVVNQVVLNTEYLYGIEEMPSSWGTVTNGGAALQAQAIVARNYAITEKLKGLKPACECHVYDDTRSQNYTGWRKQGGSHGNTWTAAVDATVQTSTVSVLREVASNTIVESPYFASSGKVTSTLRGTAANRDAFGTTALPHLAHVGDAWSTNATDNPYRSWSDSITQSQAKSIFGMTWVRSVAVTARYSSGQVKTLTATSSTGTKVARTKTAEGWRTALGLTGGWVASVTGR
jgi:stage II sporulation protein D